MTVPRVGLNSRRIVTALGVTIALLAIAHLMSQVSKHLFGFAGVYGLVDLFDMDVEANVPTYFAGMQLLGCSLVLAVIGMARSRAGDPFARHWKVLGLMLLLFSVDEIVSVHELSIRLGWEFAPGIAQGIFYWIWVLPASVLVAVVSVSYARFVFSYLPAHTRNCTVLGAGLFVGGALGVEMLEARHVQREGMENFAMGIYVLLEETLEKIGILVFLAGALEFLRTRVGTVALEVVRTQPASQATRRQVPAETAGIVRARPRSTA